MPIEKEDDGFVAYCSTCGEGVETDKYKFGEAVEHIKDEGWKVFKDKLGEWNHVCNNCTEGLK